jgi:hypothetical protein
VFSIVQAASTLAAAFRSLLEDVVLGFASGGIAGALVRVVRGSAWTDPRASLVVSRWALFGAGIALSTRLIEEVV